MLPSTTEGQIMLVLTRRVGEEIIINNNIRVTVVAVQGNRIRLGITAPNSVVVERKELHDRRMEFHAVEADECVEQPVGAR
jgi:carbon storage regulator